MKKQKNKKKEVVKQEYEWKWDTGPIPLSPFITAPFKWEDIQKSVPTHPIYTGCAIDEYFKQHPNETACLIHCSCPKCAGSYV
jgi:hypothetical protein